MAVIIKLFSTPNGLYVYDRETNSILSVNDYELPAFKRLETNSATEQDRDLFIKYRERGYLQESRLQEIEHPSTNVMEFHLASRINQLTMQVTQDCNLRCSYCTYSGVYDHQRTHSKKTMTLNTMKKCVDFIVNRSIGIAETTIGFYGGEPLLEIHSIRKCVEYVKEKYAGKKINYTITTNGTVMNDEIVNFLEENNINLLISIDGPKDLHDANRVYADGRGTFDDIIKNVEYIKDKFPAFFKHVTFATTVAPNTDFQCVNDFFNATDILEESFIHNNSVNVYNSKQEIRYEDKYCITDSYERMKLLLSKINLYSSNKVSKLFSTEIVDLHRFYKTLSKISITEKAHPGGPCLPGVMRPFVDVEGRIYPCERVNENSAAMQIGHVETGFDMNKIEAMLNVAKLTPDECKECWCFLHCALCVVACDAGDKLSGEERLKYCDFVKNTALTNLLNVCLLTESNYDFDRQIAKAKGRNIYYE